MFSIIIQFYVICQRHQIIPVNNNEAEEMFSFMFAMGILVSFFKLASDILVMYGARKVSASSVACNMAAI